MLNKLIVTLKVCMRVSAVLCVDAEVPVVVPVLGPAVVLPAPRAQPTVGLLVLHRGRNGNAL